MSASNNLKYNQNVPTFIDIPIVTKDGMWSEEWKIIMQALFKFLQINFSPEGLVTPTLSSANNSVNPPETGGEIALITANAKNGTFIYDSNTDKVLVKKNDGLFHEVVTL